MINEIISALLQVIAFSLIPLIVYLIKKRSLKGFFDYIGLKKSNRKANALALLIVLVLVVPMLVLTVTNSEFNEIMTNPKSMTGKFKAMGFGAGSVVLILVTAGIKTALAEEIFFRGFVAKRLIAVTNYQVGNLMQASIFGVIHTLLFMTITSNIFFLFVIFFFPALGAYFKVYLNEKMAAGSIVPGWIAHGVGNVVAYSVVAFLL